MRPSIVSALLLITTISFAQTEQKELDEGLFCEELQSLIEAGNDYFEDIRGEKIREESGFLANRVYYKSNFQFSELPEGEIEEAMLDYFMVTISEDSDMEYIQEEFDYFKGVIEGCLGEEWVMEEGDLNSEEEVEKIKFDVAESFMDCTVVLLRGLHEGTAYIELTIMAPL